MFDKMLEKMTGKDDLERVAYKGDVGKLNAYLKMRKVLIPRRPRRFLDAANFTKEQLLEQIRKDAEDLSGTSFEPWIFNSEGKRRLPVFSSQQKMQNFAAKVSKEMHKVFSLGWVEFLLDEITKNLDIGYVDLNLFSDKSWEIEVRKSGT